MHPYFNQTWGFFALPFALVLSVIVMRHRTRGGLALLAAFLAVLAFAYPLALPIPLAAAVAVSGLPRPHRPTRRQLLWLVPLGLVLLIPLYGVLEKMITAAKVVAPGGDLGPWGGDLPGFYGWNEFLGAATPGQLWLFAPILLAGIVLALRAAPRDVRNGLTAVLVFGLVAAIWFRVRDHGWYFHFKVLAFTAPLALCVAAVGLARVRVWGAIALVLLLLSAREGARLEMARTYDQLPRSILALRDVDAQLPPDASVRLDMPGNLQLWVAYMLSGQPLCSQTPLSDTQYPHVPASVAADYALAERDKRPRDAVGPPVRRLEQFDLYRLRRGLPYGDRCSRRMVQTVTRVT
jgi:hypothetical protein